MVLVVRKKRKEATISKLKAKVWKIFSQYTRSRYADFRDNVACFTCDRVDHWKSMDAGHYIPKSTGGAALYFHEKNVHPQCTACNRFRHGNLTQYALKLRSTYGDTILEELNALRGKSWDRRELERLMEYYNAKMRQ